MESFEVERTSCMLSGSTHLIDVYSAPDVVQKVRAIGEDRRSWKKHILPSFHVENMNIYRHTEHPLPTMIGLTSASRVKAK